MQQIIKNTSLAAAIALLASLGAPAYAANDTIRVDADVVQSCVLEVPTALNFGEYDPTGINLTEDKMAQTTIQVKCASGTGAAMMYIDKGTTKNATYTQCTSTTRQMFLNGNSGSVEAASYFLYKDASMTNAWGCQVGTAANLGGSVTGPFTSSITPINVTVYGKVTKNQSTLAVGDYSDVVSVWIAF